MKRVTLGELCDVKGGKRLPKGEVYAESRTKHPYLRVCDFAGGSIADRDLQYISEDTHSKISRYTIASDDVFISIAGTIGLVGLVPEHLSGANLTENAAKLKIHDSSILDKRYLAKYLSTEGQADISVRKRAVGQPKLALFRIAEIPIPLPPLAEQKRIAAILDAADALRAKRRESLEQLDTLLHSTFLDMFGDPLNHEGVNKLVGFRDLTSRITYGFTCPMEHVPDGIPIITAKNVRQGSIDFENCHFATPAQFEELTDKSKPEEGDLLITKDGAIRGRCALVNTDSQFCINQAVALVRPDRSSVVPEYLWGYIANYRIQRKIMEMDKGAAMPHLQITELAKFPIALPPLELQHRFATIVESIEQQKASQRAHLAELDTLFASLQSLAFKGEL